MTDGGGGDVVVTGSASCDSSSIGSGTVTCRPAPQSAQAEEDSATSKDAPEAE
ncbi:MAG: hypothetical protein AAFS10_08855 [Myxococcota bacterium]